MRLIIEAGLEGAQTGGTAVEATIVDVVERQDRSVADLGLTLAEGRALVAKVQSILVSQQTAGWMASQAWSEAKSSIPRSKTVNRIHESQAASNGAPLSADRRAAAVPKVELSGGPRRPQFAAT